MPSVSKKQHNAMAAAAHGNSTLGIPKSVGEDFSNADKGREFAGGGPITAASIEAGGMPNQGDGIASTPNLPTSIDPISTTTTPPGGGFTPSGPQPEFGGGPVGWQGGKGITPNWGQNPEWGTQMEDGGMVPNTTGASYSFPPPPGQRKQGPRNYGKKE